MRKGSSVLLVLALLLTLALPVLAAEERGPSVPVYVDGERVDPAGVSYEEADTVYVPIRHVSEALGATAVIWDPSDRAALVEAPGLTLRAAEGDAWLTANGRCLYIPGLVRTDWGRVTVPAEALVRAFGASLSRGEDGALLITSGTEPIEDAASFYGEEDLTWLSRIIQAEAGGESLEGKIGVANVVLNRVSSDEFPDTVKAVIFDKRYGVQFTPAYSGGIYNKVSEESLLAAKLALDGASTAGESLYFAASAAAKYCWAARHREVYGQIDHQVFYT